MSEHEPNWSSPPPRRPVPEQLRNRIATELTREQRRGHRSRSLIAAVAATFVLVAAIFGIAQLRLQQGVGPALSPSAEPTPAATTSGATPSPTPTPGRPQQLVPLSKAQTADDLERCTTGHPADQGGSPPHRGTYRAVLALDVPVITLNAAQDRSVRIVSAEDDAGRYDCENGVEQSWAATNSAPAPEPDAKHPAAELRNSGVTTSCDAKKRTGTAATDSYWGTTDAVAVARVELKVNGQLTRSVDLAPHDGVAVLAIRLSGAAMFDQITWSVQFLDRTGTPLAIASNQQHPVQSSKVVGDTLPTCDVEEQPAPPAIRRPTSDAAGVSACRKAVKEYVSDAGATAFDSASADPVLTVSTAQAWGTILENGGHYVACSRYPTREISDVTAVSDKVRAETFGWAENPIPTGGETLWAAGKIPGLRSVTYQLPDGRRVAGQVEPDGWWMVMASTSTAFDTEENTADWEPVRVEVRTATGTRTFDLPWNEKTSCNQVSHGC